MLESRTSQMEPELVILAVVLEITFNITFYHFETELKTAGFDGGYADMGEYYSWRAWYQITPRPLI